MCGSLQEFLQKPLGESFEIEIKERIPEVRKPP